MEEGLKIKVGADVLDVTKSIATLEDEFEALQKTIAASTDGKEVVELNKRLEGLRATIQSVKNAGKVGFDDFGQKLAQIKKPAGDATNALTNFGRIAQDAPFGLIGITNNINPALESFQRLTKETGSTGAALKSLVSGLAGPAGIGVAVSVITSAVTSLVLKYGSLGSAIDVLTSNLSDMDKAQRSVNESFAKSAANAESERQTMNALFEIARNTALSTNARKEAIDKINQDYGSYISNLKLETVNTDAVNKAQERLNQTLINQARIKGVQDLITSEAKKQAELYMRLNDRLAEKNGFGKMIDAISSLNPVWQGSGIDKKAVDIFNLGKEFEDSEKRMKLFNESLKGLLTTEAQSGNLFTKIPKKAKEAIEKTTLYFQQGLTPIEIPAKLKLDKRYKIEEIFHKIDSVEVPVYFKDAQILSVEGYNNFKRYWDDQAKKNPLYIKVEDNLKGIGDNYSKFFTGGMIKAIEQAKLYQAQLKSIAEYAGGALADTFTNLFRTIATDGKLSIKTVGNAIKQLVIDLIAAALRAAALAVILKAFGLGGSSSFGSMFRGILSGVGGAGMATGGIVPPGYPNDSFPARLTSNEAVIPLDRLDSIMGNGGGGGTLSARVSGNDLLFILDRTSRSKRRSF